MNQELAQQYGNYARRTQSQPVVPGERVGVRAIRRHLEESLNVGQERISEHTGLSFFRERLTIAREAPAPHAQNAADSYRQSENLLA